MLHNVVSEVCDVTDGCNGNDHLDGHYHHDETQSRNFHSTNTIELSDSHSESRPSPERMDTELLQLINDSTNFEIQSLLSQILEEIRGLRQDFSFQLSSENNSEPVLKELFQPKPLPLNEKTESNKNPKDEDLKAFQSGSFSFGNLTGAKNPNFCNLSPKNKNKSFILTEDLSLQNKLKSIKSLERGKLEIKTLQSKIENQSSEIFLFNLSNINSTFKLFFNHLLTTWIKFQPLTNRDRALTWFVPDYSEGVLNIETLAIKFKNSDHANEFKRIVEVLQSQMKNDKLLSIDNINSDQNNTNNKLIEEDSKETCALKPLADLFKPKVGSWKCKICFIRNEESSSKCIACETPKPDKPQEISNESSNNGLATKFKFGIPEDSKEPLADFFKPKAGSWECKGCLISNEESASKCIACETPKPDKLQDYSNGPSNAGLASKFTFGMPQDLKNKPNSTFKFTFGIPPSENKSETPSIVSDLTVGSTTKYTFGMPQDLKDKPKSTFKCTFGIPPSENKSETPSFIRDVTVGSTTKYTFGKPQDLKDKPNSTFTFGIPPSENKSETPSFIRDVTVGSTTKYTFGIPQDLKDKPNSTFKYTFGIPPSDKNDSETTSTTSSTSSSLSTTFPLDSQSNSNMFSFGIYEYKSTTYNQTGKLPSLKETFQSKLGSWDCKKCFSRNEASANYCTSCKSIHPNKSSSAAKTTQSATTTTQSATTTTPSETTATQSATTPTQPATTAAQTETTATQHKTTVTQPTATQSETTTTQPATMTTQPETKTTQSEATATQSETTATQPETAATQSGTTGTQSAATATQSAATATQSETTATQSATTALHSALNLEKKSPFSLNTSTNLQNSSASSLKCSGKTNTQGSFNFGNTSSNLAVTPPDSLPKASGEDNKNFIFNNTNNKPIEEDSKETCPLKHLAELFKRKRNLEFWKCKWCFTINEESSSKCIKCEIPKPDKVQYISKEFFNMFSFGIYEGKLITSNQTGKLPCLKKIFQSKPRIWECKKCFSRNEKSANYCTSCESIKPNKSPSAAKPIWKKSPFKTSTNLQNSSASGFKFSGKTNIQSSFKFGNASSNLAVTPTDSLPKASGEDNTIFTFGTFKFSGIHAKPSDKSGTHGIIGGARPFYVDQINFASPRPHGTAILFSESEAADENEGDQIYFQPIITLPNVPIYTGEEEEETLYQHRAKLFRFFAGEWKERGIGVVKLLKHKETGKIRILMRRDQVLKICANHFITMEMRLFPKDDKSWIWAAQDFSEGEIVQEKFAIRFKTSDIANDFKEAFLQAQVRDVTDRRRDFIENDHSDGHQNTTSSALSSKHDETQNRNIHSSNTKELSDSHSESKPSPKRLDTQLLQLTNDSKNLGVRGLLSQILEEIRGLRQDFSCQDTYSENSKNKPSSKYFTNLFKPKLEP